MTDEQRDRLRAGHGSAGPGTILRRAAPRALTAVLLAALFMVSRGVLQIACVLAWLIVVGGMLTPGWRRRVTGEGQSPGRDSTAAELVAASAVPAGSAGRRVHVVLTQTGERRPQTVHEVRRITGLDFESASALVDDLPATLLTEADPAAADDARQRLALVGAQVVFELA